MKVVYYKTKGKIDLSYCNYVFMPGKVTKIKKNDSAWEYFKEIMPEAKEKFDSKLLVEFEV